MKRDWDLLRWILNEAESSGYPIVLGANGLKSACLYLLSIC